MPVPHPPPISLRAWLLFAGIFGGCFGVAALGVVAGLVGIIDMVKWVLK